MSPELKRTSSSTPSKAEKAAQRWHKDHHSIAAHGECWCRCTACEHANPHHAKARAAALADIKARIRDSMVHVRLRPPEGI